MADDAKPWERDWGQKSQPKPWERDWGQKSQPKPWERQWSQNPDVANVQAGQPTISQRDVSTAQAGTGWQGMDPLLNPIGPEQIQQRKLHDITAQSAQNIQQLNKQSPLKGTSLAAVQGPLDVFTAGLANRGVAGARALRTGAPYEEELARTRGWMEENQRQNPWTYGLSSLGAGVGLAGLLGGASVSQNLAFGTGYGALSGAASSPNLRDYRDVANRSLQGGAIGAALSSPLDKLFPKTPPTVTPHALPVKQAAQEVAQAKWGNEVAQAVKGGFQDAFGYGTETAQAGKAEARAMLGQNARNVSIRERNTDAFQKEFQNLDPTADLHPGTLNRMQTVLAGNPDAAKAVSPSKLAFMEYIQKRSTGLPFPLKDKPEMRALADELRAQHEDAYARVAKLPEKYQFTAKQDYLKGAYEMPKTGQGRGPRGISGGFTKAKTYPSYVEAIEAGRVPKTNDPIALTAFATANSDQWAAKNEWLTKNLYDKAKNPFGQIRFARPNKIPTGMTALSGFDYLKNSGRFIPVASSDYAQIWNTTYSRGLEEYLGQPIMDTVRNLGNAAKQADLGFSGYHGFTMMWEYNASQLGQTWNEALNMRPGMAAKSAVESVVGPFREMTPMGRGQDLINEFTRPGNSKDPTMRLIADLATSANYHVKPTQMDILRSEAGGPSGLTAWEMAKRGILGKEFKAGARSIVKDWSERPVRMAIQTAIGTAVGGLGAQQSGVDPREGALAGAIAGAGGLRPLQKMTEAVMSPLFRTYIPRMKAAAFYNKMDSFLKLNPTASRADMENAARTISDSTDNRFGELNRDNLFWASKAHDIAQMTFLSPTWQIGTIREIAGAYPQLLERMGGAKLLESGEGAKGLSTKLEYIAGFVTSTYVMGSLYEHFMTEGGKRPENAVAPESRDLPVFAQMHPRTGGVIPRPPGAAGKYQPNPIPEEAIMPGYGKEVIGARNIIQRALKGDFAPMQQEVANKGSPLVHMLDRLLTGEDWKGTPIADPHEGLTGTAKAALGGIGQSFIPISAQQLAQSAKPGTGIPWWQVVMGFRQAGKQYYDPKGYNSLRDAMRNKAAGEDVQGAQKAFNKVKGSKEPGVREEAHNKLIRARREAAESKHRARSYGGNPE